MACVRRSRPCLAVPPAESPSTMKSFGFGRVCLIGSRRACPATSCLQARLCAERESLAALAALRAFMARMTLLMMARASSGFSSRKASNARQRRCRPRSAPPCAELGFGLAFELDLAELDRDDRGQAFEHIVAGECFLAILWRYCFSWHRY